MNVFRIFNTCDTHKLFFLQENKETNDNRDWMEYEKEIRHRGVCCVGVRHQNN